MGTITRPSLIIDPRVQPTACPYGPADQKYDAKSDGQANDVEPRDIEDGAFPLYLTLARG